MARYIRSKDRQPTTPTDPDRLVFLSDCGYWTDDRLKLAIPFNEPVCPHCRMRGRSMRYEDLVAAWELQAKQDGDPAFVEFALSKRQTCFSHGLIRAWCDERTARLAVRDQKAEPEVQPIPATATDGQETTRTANFVVSNDPKRSVFVGRCGYWTDNLAGVERSDGNGLTVSICPHCGKTGHRMTFGAMAEMRMRQQPGEDEAVSFLDFVIRKREVCFSHGVRDAWAQEWSARKEQTFRGLLDDLRQETLAAIVDMHLREKKPAAMPGSIKRPPISVELDTTAADFARPLLGMVFPDFLAVQEFLTNELTVRMAAAEAKRPPYEQVAGRMDRLPPRDDHTWIQMPSGVQFWSFNPHAADVRLSDIAHNTGNKCRFTGATEPFYSVAEHTVRGTEEILIAFDGSLRLARLFAIHDASEAYLPDVARPHKPLMPGFDAAEARVMAVVYRYVAIEPPTPVEQAAIKGFDGRMLATERRDLMPKFDRPCRESDNVKPFKMKIVPWTPAEARERYSSLLSRLFPGLA